MVILHIARLDSFKASGVNVVVPQHVLHQRQFADAALWNIGEPLTVEGLEQNYSAESIDKLPQPYREPDIAVFHEIYKPEFISIAHRLRKRGVPYVIVPHGSLNRTAQKKSRWKKLPANALMFKPFCRNAAAIQFLSHTEQRECVFKLDCTFIASNGIDPKTVIKTTFRRGGIRFVYIGRLELFNKGIDIMIRTFSSLKEFLRESGSRLDIYGPDTDDGVYLGDRLKRLMAEADADDVMAIHPAVFGEEKERVLLDSDVFVQTSRSDGMPMGILEALSYGLPCLITEGCSLDDMVSVSGAGWTAKIDEADIAKAVRLAVEQSGALAEKSQNALRCIEAFRWDKVSKTAVERYSRLCKKER